MFQNDNEETEGRERKGNRPGLLRCGYCVKQGNVVSLITGSDWDWVWVKNSMSVEMVMWYVFQRKSWKRRFFTLDDNAVNYYKTESVRNQGFHVFAPVSTCLRVTVIFSEYFCSKILKTTVL